MDFLTEPFDAEFVRTGALAAAVVGVLAGVVGCYVILRGMALMADSLAHGVLPGIAIAFALTAGAAGEDPDEAALFAGALAAGLLTAAGTSLILRRSRVRQETAAGVVFVFMLALGVVIVSRVEGYSVDLTSFLFGDVLGVSGGEVFFSAILAAAVLLV
ncbi:MAG: metal ABC transporter permease, partial [Solirubrobacterales bacterium]